MTVWTFLDNVGGVAGLWLGASIVTLLRFLIVTVPMFVHGVYKSHKKVKKIQQKSTLHVICDK